MPNPKSQIILIAAIFFWLFSSVHAALNQEYLLGEKVDRAKIIVYGTVRQIHPIAAKVKVKSRDSVIT
ncbi:MAG: hypothetical protein Q8O74_09920, partial [bacterium]|nr:hypothetical protein [bacterium]